MNQLTIPIIKERVDDLYLSNDVVTNIDVTGISTYIDQCIDNLVIDTGEIRKVTPIVTDGTKIAKLEKINGDIVELYAPDGIKKGKVTFGIYLNPNESISADEISDEGYVYKTSIDPSLKTQTLSFETNTPLEASDIVVDWGDGTSITLSSAIIDGLVVDDNGYIKLDESEGLVDYWEMDSDTTWGGLTRKYKYAIQLVHQYPCTGNKNAAHGWKYLITVTGSKYGRILPNCAAGSGDYNANPNKKPWTKIWHNIDDPFSNDITKKTFNVYKADFSQSQRETLDLANCFGYQTKLQSFDFGHIPIETLFFGFHGSTNIVHFENAKGALAYLADDTVGGQQAASVIFSSASLTGKLIDFIPNKFIAHTDITITNMFGDSTYACSLTIANQSEADAIGNALWNAPDNEKFKWPNKGTESGRISSPFIAITDATTRSYIPYSWGGDKQS